MPGPATTSEYATLLAELDRGTFDGEASRALRARGDAYAFGLRAIALAGAGRLGEARDEIARALDAAPGSGMAHLIAGLVRYVTRDYDASLQSFRRAVEISPRLAGHAYRFATARASRLGWDADVRELLHRARALEPRNLRWHVEAARVHANARNYRDALACMRTAVELEPGSASFWMEVARLAALDGDPSAREAVRRALALAPRDVRYPVEASRVLTAIGELGESAQILATAVEAHPREPLVHSEMAERSLWCLDLDACETHAREALAWDEENAAAHRQLGAVALLRGDPVNALALLEEATALDAAEYRAHVFAAESFLALRRHDDARDSLTRASMSADGFLPVAWLLRMLVSLAAGEPAPRLEPNRFGEVAELLRAVAPEEADAIMQEGDHDRVRGLLEKVLRALGGNRSTTPTVLGEGGSLEPLRRLHGVRFESRKALELVRARSPEAALDALAEVVARFPGESLPECHRGELLLWLGRLGEARASLDRAIHIEKRTRWAYIGLTGIDILEGRLACALETSARGVRTMDDTEGAAVYVYRGEALRRLGRLEEATADLLRACELHPSRVGARVNLVLALLATGRDASEHLRVLQDQATGLLSDAARERGAVVDPPLERVATETLVGVLEKALEMMRGNRSSTTMTYFTSDGRIRYVPHWPHRGRGPHETDRDDLERARTLLMRATGLTRGPPTDEGDEPGPRRFRPPADAELLATFLSRGWARIEGAFSREVAERWTTAAAKRIRLAPARYVKGYDASDPDQDLSRFEPSDPSTWTWDRIDVEGHQQLRIADFAPRAWEAICTLLGGEDRVATTTWGEYFIVNLRERADDPRQAPGPDWPSWHFDDPSERARLDDCRNGLVCIWLFSDVLPRSGGTWILPDSPAFAARLLAQHPDGLDMRSTETALAVARGCPRSEELVGRAGDVFLLHPFMLHSSSPNPSGRPRWISNPMIYVKEPLVFDRRSTSEYSPVELLVARALGRA